MKKHKQYGFTIVELLLVIVVIGILASITVVAYRGIQDRAYATQYLNAIDAYEKALRQYKAFNGSYPSANDLPSGAYFACLGGPFPASAPMVENECYHLGNNAIGRVSSSVNTALSSVIRPLPAVNRTVTYQDGSDTAHLRGILYLGGSTGVSLLYIIQGDQPCGRGGKVPAFASLTYCIISLD